MWVRATPPSTNHASVTWIPTAAPHPCVHAAEEDWLVLAGEGTVLSRSFSCCAVFEARDDGGCSSHCRGPKGWCDDWDGLVGWWTGRGDASVVSGEGRRMCCSP